MGHSEAIKRKEGNHGDFAINAEGINYGNLHV